MLVELCKKLQGSFPKVMNTINDCVKAYQKLLETEYKIVIGRKGKAVNLTIYFDKEHCFHLMGLQYLKDIAQLNDRRDIVFDKILSGKITQAVVEKSIYYDSILERIEFFPLLETLLDSNNTVFKYNEKVNNYSIIEADYLLKNDVNERKVFIFLSEQSESGNYFCRSFFPYDGKDYSKGQANWTLLYKEKIYKQDNTSEILFNKLLKSS